MPFQSEAQRRWMYANDPEMAKRWEKETPKGKKLPKKKKAQIEKTAFWQGFEKAKQIAKTPHPVTWGVLGAGAGAGLGGAQSKYNTTMRSDAYLRFKNDYREKHPKADDAEIQSAFTRRNMILGAATMGATGALYGKLLGDLSKMFRGGPRATAGGPMSGAGTDALKKTLGLSGKETTKSEVLKKYKDAARKAHPDMGGSTEDMQRLNSAIEEIKKDPWFQKLALAFDGGGFFSGFGKGTDRVNTSDVSQRTGTAETPTTDKTLLDRERNPRSYTIGETGPIFEAEDGSHVKY